MNNKNKEKKVLFLGKKNDYLTEVCMKICTEKFRNAEIFLASRFDKIPGFINNWKGDFLISFLFPLLIEKKLLNNIKNIAINFHPGPPEYPGIGCTNYAIYNKEEVYGVTCHIVSENFDAGDILKVKRFKLNKNEDVYTLTQRAYLYLLEMYIEVLNDLKNNKTLIRDDKEKWKGKARTRKEFNKFLKLNINMSKSEIKRRILATTWPGRGSAYLKINGIKFEGKIEEND